MRRRLREGSMTDERILEIGDDAVAKILELREQEPGDAEYALFIEITGIRGGQFAYELSFIPVDDREDSDVLERHGDLPVVVAGKDIDQLRGSLLTMSTDPAAPGLSLNNPNAPATPKIEGVTGELTGPLAEQVAQVLAEQVNPAIAAHGGAAELVGVEGDTAYLRLSGGCQGCGLAQVTLSQGIERILVEAIPELVSVVDVTDHAAGDSPYYQAAKK